MMRIETDVLIGSVGPVGITWRFMSPLGRYESHWYTTIPGPHVKWVVLRTAVEFRRFMLEDVHAHGRAGV